MPPEIGIKVDNFTDRFHSKSHRRRGLTQSLIRFVISGADPGGGRWGGRPPLGRRDLPSSQGQKEGTLVSLEWLFNTIQA